MRAFVFTVVFVFNILYGKSVTQGAETDNHSDFFVKTFLAMPSLSLSVDSRQNEPTRLDPNRFWSTGVSFTWKELAASVSVQVGDPVDDTARFGETQYFDIQFHWYSDRLGIDGFLQSYNGYFVRDLPAGCDRGDDCSLRPDLQLSHAGLIIYYILDQRWSLRAAFSPPGLQKHSAGSWFLSGGTDLIYMHNNDSLAKGLGNQLKGGRFYAVSVAPGYGYTWVRGPWFISSAIYFGAGPMYAKSFIASDDNSTISEWVLALKAGLKIGAGYAGDNWQAGVRAFADSPYAHFDEVELQWLAQTVELYLGYRF